MKRLIIPENFVRALCKIDRRIYGYGRCSDAVEAAIGYVSGKYQFQKEAAKAHGVSRYKAHAASHVIYKSWQENRERVLAGWLQSGGDDDINSNDFIPIELAAIAAGIDTSNGLFDPVGCDNSAFKLSSALQPGMLEVKEGAARCEKIFCGTSFSEIVSIDDCCDELTALRCALFSVAVDVGMRMLTIGKKELEDAINN